jgi:hypothetical protein
MLDDPYNEGGRGATAGRVRLKGCRQAVDGTRAGASAPGRWNDPAGGALWGSRRKGGAWARPLGPSMPRLLCFVRHVPYPP